MNGKSRPGWAVFKLAQLPFARGVAAEAWVIKTKIAFAKPQSGREPCLMPGEGRGGTPLRLKLPGSP